jgi:hypothetical protein
MFHVKHAPSRTLPIMGWWAAAGQVARELVGLPRPLVLDLQPAHTFDTAPQPIDRLLTAMRNGVGPVTREVALSVSAVQRGRNEICSMATLPLRLYQDENVVPSALLRQFDPDVPNVAHLAMTVEDLAFEATAWWQVTGQDFDLYPVSVRRIAPGRVSSRRPVGPPRPGDDRYVWIRSEDEKSWQQVSAALMIRFTSPNPGILRANAADIRVARQLQDLVGMYAENPAGREFFTDADDPDIDPMKDEDVDPFLSEYAARRRASPYGWIPGNVKRVDGGGGPSPKDLALADLWQQVMIGIANGLGVDPEDIGVSTTSRTYQNEDARRRDKINRMLAPYMSAITDRLSMGDVTRRGYTVRFDLTDYLKADPAGRVAYYQAMQTLIGLKPEWIAQQEGIPLNALDPITPAAPAPAVPAASALPAGRRFDGDPAFTFAATDFAEPPPAPTVDEAARTITGLAVPYNAVADKYGMKYSFAPGSLEYSDPARLAHLKDHMTPVGFHRSVTDTAAGPMVELAVLDAPEGSPAKFERDQLLYDAAHGLYTGLSIGVDFNMDPEAGDVEYDAEADVYRVVRATWRETSSTYMPAFDDARVTKVAASRTGGPMDPCQHCGQRHAPNIACATFAAQIRNQPAPAPAPTDQFAQFQAWQQAQQTPAAPAPLALPAGPTQVNPNPAGPAEVTEPLPYRYDRQGNLRAASHDFSADIAAAYNPNYKGDLDGVSAQNRIQGWLKHAFENRDLGRLDAPAGVTDLVAAQSGMREFAITPANVVNLNYPANRPDLYVDQLDYLYPMYDAVNKGTLDTVTPFVIPKFNSSSGLVGDHVTGTEPTPGAFTATSQTITPSALSGKVEMTREVFDQGGNPQASGLIWRQMVRGWYEGLEAAVQAFLVAQSASIPDITLGVAVTDSAMDQSIASAVTALQYIRGGDRFSKVFTQIDLYQKLAKAVDTAGRPLYPSFGAMNAAGLADPSYNYLNVRGKTFVPAWATAATGSVLASSWMFDPDVVCLWASTPQRIDMQWRVAWVDIGIWGYKALGITDFTRTRELTYDPV